MFNERMRKVFIKSKQSCKPTYLMDDYNLNVFSYDTDTKRRFIQKMNENSFLPSISGITRVAKKKSTCINNIFFNMNFHNKVPPLHFIVKIMKYANIISTAFLSVGHTFGTALENSVSKS